MLMQTSITIKYNRNKAEVLTSFDSDTVTYKLTKFKKTNQGTCVNLKSIVSKGDNVQKAKFYVRDMQQIMEN